MKKSLYQSILAMLLSIVTLTPVANPVAMAAQIDHEPDSFVEELEEPDESDDAGQGKDIPDLEDVISNEDEENENSSADQIESADVDENEVIMLQLRVKVQFTMPSGLHSVLERPFSEANGRPFLVKRSPLIVC